MATPQPIRPDPDPVYAAYASVPYSEPQPVTQPATPQPNVAAWQLDEGRKDDGEKLPVQLLPLDALEGIAKVLQFGARKYAPRNWEKGMGWGRVYGALTRHLWAWWRGEKADAETGMSHLWHAGCCILFLIAYEARQVGTDDRPPPH